MIRNGAIADTSRGGSFKPLQWNRRVLRTVFALFLALTSTAAFAQTEPREQPEAAGELRDSEFGVSTLEFGLDRRVEMYQWRTADGGYERVWNSALIDSKGFAADHANPNRMPLESRRWWAEKAMLDGKPIDDAVLRTLGEWRVFRPKFSRLPANLSATFEPEGDGLSSAENPLDPQLGDLRVIWRELVLPPLAGKVVLRDGVWYLNRQAAASNPAAPPIDPAVLPDEGKAQRLWPWFAGGLLVIAAIVVLVHRRKSRKHGAESKDRPA